MLIANSEQKEYFLLLLVLFRGNKARHLLFSPCKCFSANPAMLFFFLVLLFSFMRCSFLPENSSRTRKVCHLFLVGCERSQMKNSRPSKCEAALKSKGCFMIPVRRNDPAAFLFKLLSLSGPEPLGSVMNFPRDNLDFEIPFECDGTQQSGVLQLPGGLHLCILSLLIG